MASCFFCGSDDMTSSSQKTASNSQNYAFQSWTINCVSSVSAALGLRMTPTLEQTMIREVKYCGPCLGLMRDIDFFTRSLRRIQSGLSSKTAILRRQIRRNCERLAYSSPDPVPGSREFVLRTVVESMNEEVVKNEGNAGSDYITEQEPASPLEPPILPRNRTKKSRSAQKRLPKILRVGRPKKRGRVTRKKVTNCIRLGLDHVKQEAQEKTETNAGAPTDSKAEDMGTVVPSPRVEVSGSEQSGDEDYVPEVELSDDEDSIVYEDEGEEKDDSDSPVLRSKKRKPCPQAASGCGFRTTKAGLLAAHIRKVHEGQPKPFHCQYCPKEFRSQTGLVVHERRHSRGAFRCKCCSRTLSTQKSLENHESRCTEESEGGAKTCPEPACGFEYWKEEQLAAHIRKVHGKDPKPFHCPHCSGQFKRKQYYDAHLRWHNDRVLLTCQHCSATFARQNKLNIHNRVCTAERPKRPKSKYRSAREDPPKKCTYVDCEYIGNQMELLGHERTVHLGETSPFACSVCEKGFQTALSLSAHEKLHMLKTGEAQYKCEYCPKEFWNRYGLKKHGRSSHYLEVVLDLKFSCEACTKHFGTEDELHVHAGLHEVQERPFACVLCETVPNNSVDLKLHVRHTHEEAYPQCPLCLKRFKNIEAHTGNCTKERAPPDFRCPACPYVGLNQKRLNKHRLEEHGGGNFVCQECGKQFFKEATLKLHMRNHTGELPFACSICPRRFVCATRLKDHEQTHSSQDAYFCPKCNKGFKTRPYMWQHLTMYCQSNPDRRPPARSRNKQVVEETYVTTTTSYPEQLITYHFII